MWILLGLALVVASVLMLGAGVYCFVRVSSNKFYRRNQAGLEQFSSYSNMLVTRGSERGLQYLGYFLIGMSFVSCTGGLASMGHKEKVVRPPLPGETPMEQFNREHAEEVARKKKSWW